jgi:hypothetical protein
MKINIVTVNSGWILQNIAKRIAAGMAGKVDVNVSHSPAHKSNNFYVDITNCYRGRSGGTDIGLFTHVDENEMVNVPDLWFQLDHIIHMSRNSFEQFCCDRRLEKYKTPMTYTMPGEIPPGFEYQKPTIGIFQRGKYEGKGFFLMESVVKSDIVSNFNWVFIGNDWDPIVSSLKRKTSVTYLQDNYLEYPKDYLKYYSTIDYLLVPSKWEGGPMSLIEAAALGKQIIAPCVGWAHREIPVDYYFIGGIVDSLLEVFRTISSKRKEARDIVEELSYSNYANFVIEKFKEIQ